MKAFVTGGTGFVGSHLVEALLARGYAVTCLVRNDLKWLEGLDIEVVKGGLMDSEAIVRGCAGAGEVYHIAGMTRAPSREVLFQANVDGTLNLLDAAREAGVRKVLVTSSLSAIGPSESGPLPESAPFNPVSDYGRSKAEMERQIAKREDVSSIVVVRPPAVYGPREADLFNLIKTADKQRILPAVGNGREARLNLVHVRDLVEGMIGAMASEISGGKTYFIGGRKDYSWNEIRSAIRNALGHGAMNFNIPRALLGPLGTISEGLGKVFGKYPPLNREKAREGKGAWLASSERAHRDFGYAPSISLVEGMRETVQWYREKGWL